MLTVITMAAYFIGHFMEAGVWEITNSADGMTMAFLTLSHGGNLPFVQHALAA